MIAGSSEAVISPLGLAGFSAMSTSTRNDVPLQKASRPFDKDRRFCLLEGKVYELLWLKNLRQQGKSKAAMQRYWDMDSMDAYHIASARTKWHGAMRCMTSALKDAQCNSE